MQHYRKSKFPPHNAWYRFDQQLKRWSQKTPQYRRSMSKKKGCRDAMSIGFGETYNNWVNFGAITLHPWKNLVRVDMPESTSTYSKHWAHLPMHGGGGLSILGTQFGLSDFSDVIESCPSHKIRWGEKVDYLGSISVTKDLTAQTHYNIKELSSYDSFDRLREVLEKMDPVFRDCAGRGYIYKVNGKVLKMFIDAWNDAFWEPIGSIEPTKEHIRSNSPKMKTFEGYKKAISKAYNDYSELELEFNNWRQQNNLDYFGRDVDTQQIKSKAASKIYQEYEYNIHQEKSRSIYLMKCCRTGNYKIGIGKNPTQRESTLQNEKPDIKLVGSWRGMAKHERAWHYYFSDQRIRGEWFELTPSQVRFFCFTCTNGNPPPKKEATIK